MSVQTPAEPVFIDEAFQIEGAGIEPIPERERHGTAREVGGMWAGAFLNFASLLTGSLLVQSSLGFGLGIWDSLSAIAVGGILGAVLLGAVSVSGPRSGVPQIVFSRRVFGYRGAYLAGALTLFLAIGWFAVDCVIATDALDQFVHLIGIGRSLSAPLLLLVVLVSVVVAVYGHGTVVLLERLGAALFILFSVLLFVALFPAIHWGLAPAVHGAAHVGAWILGASVTFALVASWLSFAADYSRYLPVSVPAGRVVGWIALGVALPVIAFEMLGVLFLSINVRSGDLLGTIVHHAPGPLAGAFLLFVALGMIWANYLDVYTAALVTLALDLPLRRWQTAILAGVLGGALAVYALFVTSFYTAYTNFLLVTYIWSPAWAAVVVLDLFVFGPRHYQPAAFFQHSGIRWPAILALVAGTAAALPFVNSSLWQSPLAVNVLHGADISGFVSFVVGGAVYLALRPLAARAM